MEFCIILLSVPISPESTTEVDLPSKILINIIVIESVKRMHAR